MAISKGDKLPDIAVMVARAEGPEKAQTGPLFAGKRAALFSVPGAFTPTCSARHLPGFVEKADELKAKGVDEIFCLAVNDAFVMGAWAQSAGAEGEITFIADGNGEFTRALGLEMDASGFGMGMRGQRFSMIIEDGVVKELNIEQPGQFDVSSAEYLLTQL